MEKSDIKEKKSNLRDAEGAACLTGYKAMRGLCGKMAGNPATTISVLTAAVAVAAAMAYALGEQRAERGIERQLRKRAHEVSERASARASRFSDRAGKMTDRFGSRLQHWADDEVSPRMQKYGKYASRWAKRNEPRN